MTGRGHRGPYDKRPKKLPSGVQSLKLLLYAERWTDWHDKGQDAEGFIRQHVTVAGVTFSKTAASEWTWNEITDLAKAVGRAAMALEDDRAELIREIESGRKEFGEHVLRLGKGAANSEDGRLLGGLRSALRTEVAQSHFDRGNLEEAIETTRGDYFAVREIPKPKGRPPKTLPQPVNAVVEVFILAGCSKKYAQALAKTIVDDLRREKLRAKR